MENLKDQSKTEIPKFRSLKFRLMTLITMLLILVVGVPVGLYLYQLDRNYHELSINFIESASQVVYQFIYDGMMQNDSLQIQHNLELLALDPGIRLVRLMRPTGMILYSSRTAEIGKNLHELPEELAFGIDTTPGEETFKRIGNVYSHHHSIRVQKECTACHANKGAVIAVLDVHAGFTQSGLLYDNSKKLVISGGVLIILILWVVLNFLYQSQIETRLHTIISGFEKLSRGDYDSTIHMPGKHELAFLAGKFNQMLKSLKLARQKEEKFIVEKLERADRLVTLGEVAAEIAHEVNNPAGIILTRAEFLKEEMEETNPDSVCVEDLKIIIKQTEKLADTTRSILHYAKKLPQSFEKTNLNEVIESSIKVLQPRISKRQVRVKAVTCDCVPVVWGNANQLEQVFCNLINNSLDVVPPQSGMVEITIRENGDPEKSGYRVQVRDNGPGIPKEYQDKIFSPFFTTKSGDQGTGLGLFIVKNIISNHKGTIELNSAATGGTEFIIELEAYLGEN